MEQRKRLGVMVFIGALLSVLIHIPNVMGDEVKDISIDESTTAESMGCGDMAPCGMDNDRLKTDCSKDAYFDSLKNNNEAYQEFMGLPCLCFDHSSYDLSDIVCLLPRDIIEGGCGEDVIVEIPINYCRSGTEKGAVCRVLFVEAELLRKLIENYHEKTGVKATGMLSPATNTQHKEFLEYITKELRGEKVGVVTKILLESDSSDEQGYDFCFAISCMLLIGALGMGALCELDG